MEFPANRDGKMSKSFRLCQLTNRLTDSSQHQNVDAVDEMYTGTVSIVVNEFSDRLHTSWLWFVIIFCCWPLSLVVKSVNVDFYNLKTYRLVESINS